MNVHRQQSRQRVDRNAAADVGAGTRCRSERKGKIRHSYWAVVGQGILAQSIAESRIATGWVVLIIYVLTVMVPFLANNALPYGDWPDIGDSTAGFNARAHYPLFHDLTRVDWIWLVWGLAAVLYLAVHWRIDGVQSKKWRPSCRADGTARRPLAVLTSCCRLLAGITVGFDGAQRRIIWMRGTITRWRRTGSWRRRCFPPLRLGVCGAGATAGADPLFNRPPTRGYGRIRSSR